MKINSVTYEEIHRPIYILEEEKLRRNLQLIRHVATTADVEIILAFKAYALWKTFPIFREYIHATTASSLNEALLGFHAFGEPTHTYSPAYTDDEMEEIVRCSSHVTFNSLSQYERYHVLARQVQPKVQLGLRINPEYSEVGTDLYNPVRPVPDLVLLLINCRRLCPTTLQGFIVTAIAKVGQTCFNARWHTLRRSLAAGLTNCRGLTLVEDT